MAEIHEDVAALRARNTGLFASHLVRSGGLRPDLRTDEVTDVIWLQNSAEVYLLLVHDRGWTPGRYEKWLPDTWCRLFLA